MQSSISVIVPTYNGVAYLREALSSVFEQTMLPCEIIVVDDCSTDGTVSVAEGMAGESPVALRVIRLEENSGGPARPINVGVEAATGEFIGVLDQDDMYVSESLARHAGALSTVPGAMMSFSYGAWLDRPEERFQLDEHVTAIHAVGAERGGWIELSGEAVLRLFLRHSNFVGGFPGFVFRRSAWSGCGGVCEGQRIAGDFELLCSLADGGAVVCVPEIGYLRRQHGGNMCRDEFAMRAEVVEILSRWLERRPEYSKDELAVSAVRRRIGLAGRCCRRAQEHAQVAHMCLWALRRLGWDKTIAIELGTQLTRAGARGVGIDGIARYVRRLRRPVAAG